MNDNGERPTQVVITQDKLVDLLLHVATREDIAKYAADSKADMEKYAAESKADNLRVETNLKDAILELKRANDTLESKMDNKFESLESRMGREFQKIDSRYNWIIGIILGTGFTILFSVVGMLAKGFHWF